jgi:acetyl-CoA C-acetyltransferase
MPVYKADGTLALDHEEFPRPADHRRRPGVAEAGLRALADHPLDDRGTTFRGLIRQKYPDLDIKLRAPRRQLVGRGRRRGAAAAGVAQPTPRSPWPEAARQAWSPWPTWATAPTLMLNAPVPAARKVLAKAGLTVDDIDLWEINEAFAVVAEKFIRDLRLDRDKVNVNGGAMALGHPSAPPARS